MSHTAIANCLEEKRIYLRIDRTVSQKVMYHRRLDMDDLIIVVLVVFAFTFVMGWLGNRR
jgi:hypothetical protein